MGNKNLSQRSGMSSYLILVVSVLLAFQPDCVFSSDRPVSRAEGGRPQGPTPSPLVFQNVIRPTIRRIIGHYQGLIREMAPEVPAMAPLLDDLLTLKEHWQEWPKNCGYEYSDECAQQLSMMLVLHRKIEEQALGFTTVGILDISKIDGSPRLRRNTFERGIELLDPLDRLADLASESTSQLAWSLGLYRKRLRPSLDLVLPVQKLAGQMVAQWEVAHVNLSSGEQRNDFRILYAQFIRPLTFLERHPESYQLFYHQLSDLNFTINYFHRIVTTPKAPWPGRFPVMAESLKEEWNGILRQIYH